MFDKKTRTAIKINTNNFGDGLAGRGLGLNNTIHELRPLVDQGDPGAAQPRRAADRPARAVRRARPRRRADRAGGRAAGRTSTSTSTPSSPPGRASPNRSKKRPRAARPRCEQAIHSLPVRGAADRKRDRVHAPAAPERSGPRDGRAAARPRLQGRRRQPRGGDVAEHRARRILRSAREIRAEPDRHARPSKTSRTRSKSATRCSPGSRPSRPSATTGRSPSATSRASSPRTIGVGTRRPRRLRARAERPEQRGLPVLGARQRRLDRKTGTQRHGRRSTTTTCT